MTPARLTALVDAANERDKKDDYRADVIVTTMRKLIGDKKAEMWDFFPQHKTSKKRVGVSASEYRASLKAYVEMQENLKKG